MRTLILLLLSGPGGAASALCSVANYLPNIGNIPHMDWINFLPGVGSIPFIGSGGPECAALELLNRVPQYIVGGIFGILAFLVILIAILWALFRLWFTLLSAYIMILVDIVFAPFWIVAGLFPGSSIGFTSWLRSLVANLSVFPATIVLFLLGKQFMNIFSAHPGEMFVPPLIGNPNAADNFGAIIGLGVILIAPNIVKTIREALKAPKADLSSIGAALGVGAGVPTRTVSQAAGIYTAARYDPYSTSARERGIARVLQRFIR